MKVLEDKIPQVDFDNIHALIFEVMSTNKAELAKVMGIVI